ncbi:hypothetical protein [Dialister succinatiphilus]|uniref:hypothetical protein n=1 Tax=Dialister succinatiphilus TaxID=487173 RepID=UPI0040296D2B
MIRDTFDMWKPLELSQWENERNYRTTQFIKGLTGYDRDLYKALKCVFTYKGDEDIIVDIMIDKGATLLPYATIKEWLINEWNHSFINSIEWTIKAVLIGLENADIHVIETPYGVLVYSNYSALPTNILG